MSKLIKRYLNKILNPKSKPMPTFANEPIKKRNDSDFQVQKMAEILDKLIFEDNAYNFRIGFKRSDDYVYHTYLVYTGISRW